MNTYAILRRCVLTTGMLVFGLLSPAVQAERSFDKSVLQGTYTYVNNTDGIGGAGLISFDGAGKVELAIKVNVRAQDGGRKTVALSGTGTYSIDGSGMGVVNIKARNTAGKEMDLAYDFVITELSGLVATEVFSILQTGGLQGQLVAPTWKRR
jgi:hypothetical protein